MDDKEDLSSSEDNSMRIYLGADAPPSMTDFENQEKYLARMKDLDKLVKRLDNLRKKLDQSLHINQKDRREMLIHRDLIGIVTDAIKANCYFERPFIDAFLKTLEAIILETL